MSAALDILLVDDSPSDMFLTEHALAASRFTVQSSQCLGEALDLLLKKQFDVILLDLGLPDSQGLDTLRTVRGLNSQIAVVVLTGNNDEQLALQALKEGAQDYLVKGDLQPRILQRAIRYAVERSGSERKIRQSEERVHELTEHIDQVLWIVDAEESKVIYVSRGYEKLWGRSCQNLFDAPRGYMEGVHPLDLEMMQREDAAMYQTGKIDAEFRVLRPDGSIRWAWVRGYPVRERDCIVRLVGVIEDITEKRKLAEERDTLLNRLQLYIERLPLAYALFDADMRIIDWNPMAERIYGFSKQEMLGQAPPYEQIVPRSFWEKGNEIRERLRAGNMETQLITENIRKDGRTIVCQQFNTPLMEKGQFAGYILLAQDITEQKSLEEQLRQAQKMEAIGQLAGGVAHDFNNVLTVISGYCELSLANLAPDDPMRELLHPIKDAGDRAASLTSQLLAFSRKSVLEPKILELNVVVQETEKFLKRLIGEDIVLSSILDQSISRVKIDPAQLGQVLMNLAVNARDAMPKGGKLTLETRNVELGPEFERLHADVHAGRYVLLSISDTGSGMSPAVKARIFEPFFTTKGVGKGTGLGLSVVLGIVKQSDGHVEVYSEENIGTTFKLYFPAVDQQASAPKTSDSQSGGRGSETILLTEDDDAVRKLAQLVLQAYGYKVLTAVNGASALRIVEEHPDEIRLLLTDVVMPGMSGPELAAALLGQLPQMKVLFSSGYTDDAVVRHGLLKEKVAFIQKPYAPLALIKKVRQLLDEK